MKTTMGDLPQRTRGIFYRIFMMLAFMMIALAFLAEANSDTPFSITPVTMSGTAFSDAPPASTSDQGHDRTFSTRPNSHLTDVNSSTLLVSTDVDNAAQSSGSNPVSETSGSSGNTSSTGTSPVNLKSGISNASTSTRASSTTTITVTASEASSSTATSYSSTVTQTVTWSWKKTEHVTMTVAADSSTSSLELSTASTGSRPSVSPIGVDSSASTSSSSTTDAGFFKPDGSNATSTTGTEPTIVTAPALEVPTVTDNIVFSSPGPDSPQSISPSTSTSLPDSSVVTAAPSSSSTPFPNNNYTTFWESYSSYMSAHTSESAVSGGSSPSMSQPPVSNNSQAVTASPDSSSPPPVLTASRTSSLTFTSTLPAGVWISTDSLGIPFSMSSYVSAGRTFQSNLGAITTTCVPTTTVTAAPAGTVSTTRVFLQCGPGIGPQVTDSIVTGSGISTSQALGSASSTTPTSIQVTAGFPPSAASSSTTRTAGSSSLAAALGPWGELSTMALHGPSTTAAGTAGTISGVVPGSQVRASVPTTFSTSTIAKRGLGRVIGLGMRVGEGRRALGRLFWV